MYPISNALALATAWHIGDALGIDRTSVGARNRRGQTCTPAEAEKIAVHLGLDVAEIWPEWSSNEGSVLLEVPPPGDWARRGRCKGVPSEVFFPTRGDKPEQALAVCRLCPVRRECLDYTLTYPRLSGVWGGTTGLDRRRIRSGSIGVPEFDEAPTTPRHRGSSGELTRTLTALLDHPGRWARVGHYTRTNTANSTVRALRSGRRAVPPGSWSFEARDNPAGGSDLFARFDGPALDVVAS